MKLRIKFAKQGAMRFVGHLDIMRYFQKVMRRANVNICYSEGYSPHQIMSFASPLGVGMTSRAEYVDIEVTDAPSSAAMLRQINDEMVEGMEALSCRKLPDHAAGAMSIVAAADYVLTFREAYEPKDWNDFAEDLQKFVTRDQILVMKKTKKGEKETDIRPMIYELSVGSHEIWMRVAAGSAANLKPELVIRGFYESRGETMAQFALMTERREIYADLGKEGQRELCPLNDLGEDIE